MNYEAKDSLETIVIPKGFETRMEPNQPIPIEILIKFLFLNHTRSRAMFLDTIQTRISFYKYSSIPTLSFGSETQ